jgi:TPR repeat protein
MFLDGRGIAQDKGQALALYRRGCDSGDGSGCTNLGLLLEDGNGVTQDKAQASAWYRKGCDVGDAEGCSRVKKLPQK